MTKLLEVLENNQDLKEFLDSGYEVTSEDASAVDEKTGKTALWFAVSTAIMGHSKKIGAYADLQ